MEKLKIIVWKLTPIWFGSLIYRTTGYLMAARFNEGKIINFYFQKEEPSNFDAWPKK